MITSATTGEQPRVSNLFRSAAGDVLAGLLLGAVIWIPLAAVCHRDALLPGSGDRLTLLTIVMGNQIGFGAVGLYRFLDLRRVGRLPAARLSKRKAVFAGMLLTLVLIALGLVYDQVLRVEFGPGSPTLGPWGAARSVGTFASFLIVVLGVTIGPVCDELFFRANIFGRWASAGRPWSGAWLSALTFAFARLDAWNFGPYVVMGLLQAWAYRRSGSLLTPLTAHALTNAAMFGLLFSGYE